jgi:hypothetical protein
MALMHPFALKHVDLKHTIRQSDLLKRPENSEPSRRPSSCLLGTSRDEPLAFWLLATVSFALPQKTSPSSCFVAPDSLPSSNGKRRAGSPASFGAALLQL